MKTYYIYETLIEHPRFGTLHYVGQHGWNGEGQDPKYYGSCQYRYFKSWINKYPYTVNVLEYCSGNEVDRKEQYYIEQCLLKNGSFLKGTNVASDKVWLSQFRIGTCLNGRISGTSHLRDSQIVSKGNITKWNNMTKEQQLVKMQKMRAAKTADSYKNAVSHSDYAKRSIVYKEQARKVLLSDGFVGCHSEVNEHLGLKHSSRIVSDAYKKGFVLLTKYHIGACPTNAMSLEELQSKTEEAYQHYIEMCRNRGLRMAIKRYGINS